MASNTNLSNPTLDIPGLILGLGVMIIGTLAFLRYEGYFPGLATWRLWPILGILIGAVRLFSRGWKGAFWSLLLIGLSSLVLAWGFTNTGVFLLHRWPVLVILAGIWLCWKAALSPRVKVWPAQRPS